MTDAVKESPVGIAHFSAIQLPPQQFVRHAAVAGFNSVGLRLHPAFPGAPYYKLPQGSRDAMEFRLYSTAKALTFLISSFSLLARISALPSSNTSLPPPRILEPSACPHAATMATCNG